MDEKKVPASVDEYIQSYPEAVQEIMQKIRAIIHEAAPQVTEAISYGMPTFRLGKNLVHFAAFKKHIGLYPTPSGVANFTDELANYQYGKGSIRLPLNQPIPYDLIRKIVEFRVREMSA